MRTIALLAPILAASFIVSSLQAEDVIKDKSPDGKFALRLTHGEEGWDTAIVDAKTKKKIIDLENVAASGDKVRTDWMVRGGYQSLEDYGKEATLFWSNDSQRVAYFDESRDEHTASVYFRSGDTFEEALLPEIPRCDEVKEEDPKYLSTVWYKITPEAWLDSQTLLVSFSGEWRTLNDKEIGCEQNITLAFDAQHHASVAKVEKPREEIGRRIESPKGTFFVEELDVPTKDDEGNPDVDDEVWIVSAKDPAQRERLPDFYEKSGSAILHGVSISPDENWIVVAQHYGSHMNSTFLLHRTEGLKFAHMFNNTLDREAWRFFSKIEGVPLAKIDAYKEPATPLAPASVYDWSNDSGRVLLGLSGGLTGKEDDVYYAAEHKQPGVDSWFFYYNTRTQKFEVTEKLRKANKNARKRWKSAGDDEAPEDGFVPPSAESIGHEGPDLPVAERLKKYEAELAAMVKRRAGQLDGADRAEFEKKEADWRDKLENDAAQIKDPAKRLGMRARSTWYHLINVREERLPIYEEAKSGDTKQSQP